MYCLIEVNGTRLSLSLVLAQNSFHSLGRTWGKSVIRLDKLIKSPVMLNKFLKFFFFI